MSDSLRPLYVILFPRSPTLIVDDTSGMSCLRRHRPCLFRRRFVARAAEGLRACASGMASDEVLRFCICRKTIPQPSREVSGRKVSISPRKDGMTPNISTGEGAEPHGRTPAVSVDASLLADRSFRIIFCLCSWRKKARRGGNLSKYCRVGLGVG